VRSEMRNADDLREQQEQDGQQVALDAGHRDPIVYPGARRCQKVAAPM
jgi:hypothetical protein